MKRPALIIPAPIGQLGNRLFNFAHLLAISAEYGVPALHFAFHPYTDYFKGSSKQAFPVIDPSGDFFSSSLAGELWRQLQLYLSQPNQMLVETTRAELLNYRDWSELIAKATSDAARETLFAFGFVLRSWVESRVFRQLSAEYIQIGDEGFYPHQDPRWSSTEMLVLDGWGLSSGPLLERHRPSVLKYLAPTQDIKYEVTRRLSTLRNTRRATQPLIGLHVRRGDYAEWQGGKYFFSWEQYQSIARALCENQKLGCPRVLVCSNEAPPPGCFQGLDVVVSNGSAVVDLYQLAGCDAVIGPPSTFTGWASFSSRVPVFSIPTDGSCPLVEVNNLRA